VSESRGPYRARPPLMQERVEDAALDVMIVRDTVRRAAGLLGFNVTSRAQLASAGATLADLVLKTGEKHIFHIGGVIHGDKIGLQISCEAPWLAGVASNNVLMALRTKLAESVDEIMLDSQGTPMMIVVAWLTDARKQPTTDEAS
jgi:hypothetical protein